MVKKESIVNVAEEKDEQVQKVNLQSSRYHQDEYAKMSDGMVP